MIKHDGNNLHQTTGPYLLNPRLNYNYNRLFIIFISFAIASGCYGLAFLIFDPDIKLFGKNKISEQITYRNIEFDIVKSPRETVPRIIIYKNSFQISTAMCDGVESAICLDEFYAHRNRPRAKAVSLTIIKAPSNIIKGGEYIEPISGRVVNFKNGETIESIISNRKSKATAHLMFSIICFLLCSFFAAIVNHFKRSK